MSVSSRVARLPRDLLVRTRLHTRLDLVRALGTIEGARGSGKTALLLLWLSSLDGPAAYLDRADCDNPWQDVLTQIAPNSDGHGLDAVIEAVGHSSSITTIVIDGLGAEGLGLLSGQISPLLASADRVRVIVAGRDLGELTRAAEGALLDVVSIGPREMYLDDAEIEAILGGPAPASHRDVVRLPLAATLTARERALNPNVPIANAIDHVGTRILSMALDGTSEATMISLERAAVGERIESAPLFPDALMDELRLRGMTVSGAIAGAAEIEPAYRQALLNNFETRDPGEYRELRAQRAIASERDGRPLDALEHFLAAKDLAGASRVARHHWLELSEIHSERTAGLLNSLDSRTVFGYGTLLALTAELTMRAGDRWRARTLWKVTLMSIKSSAAATPQDTVWTLFLRCRAYRMLGHFERSVEASKAALEMLTPEFQNSMASELAPTMFAEFGTALLFAGSFRASRHAFELGASIAPRGSISWFACRSKAAGVASLVGNMLDARAVLADIDSCPQLSGFVHTELGTLAVLGRAMVRAEAGEPAEAQILLDAIEGRASTTEHWPFVTFIKAVLHHQLEQPEHARTVIVAALIRGAHPPTSRTAMNWVSWIRCATYFSLGQTVKARSAFLALIPEAPATVLARALEALMSNDPRAAFIRASCFLQGDELDTDNRSWMAGLMVLAVSAIELGECEIAISALERLAGMVATLGTRLPLSFLRRGDRQALSQFLSELGRNELAIVVLSDSYFVPLIPSPTNKIHVSAAEGRVLDLLVTQSSLSAIAGQLSVSPNTVKSHIRAIYSKLGARTRLEALQSAARHGLIEPNISPHLAP